MFEERFTHAFSQLSLSVHDICVSALAAAVITLGVVLLMELRCVLRMRQIVDNQLGRVFEQLDLLRFETQQLLEGQQSIESRDSRAVAPVQESALAARVDPLTASIAARPVVPDLTPVTPAAALRPPARGVTAGEARLLSSLAQARSRRAEGVTA